MNGNEPRVLEVPILTYHQVEPINARSVRQPGLVVSVASFRWQIFLLRALGYRSITLDELTNALASKYTLPQRSIVITFDDGYAGMVDHAVPILRQHGFIATCFLIAEDFEDRPSMTQRSFPVVTRTQVAEIAQAGFRIGSHSITHSRLTELPIAQARAELTQSKKILEDAFQTRVTTFSYPYGAFNSELQALAAETGYECATSIRFGRRQAANERFALKRIPVGHAQRLPHFVYRLLWARDA